MIRILFIISLLISSEAAAESYHWKVKKVIDGDTIQVEAPFLPKELKLSVRVLGIDTPEKGWRAGCKKEAALGESATKLTTSLVVKSKDVSFDKIKWDKFGGRVLAEVTIDGVNLGDNLIKAGLAREYRGEKKTSWCN
tara:strand:+ start:31983 stop:32396 length:414 start_codon:yes stop_codon:yes gene_type:complete